MKRLEKLIEGILALLLIYLPFKRARIWVLEHLWRPYWAWKVPWLYSNYQLYVCKEKDENRK